MPQLRNNHGIVFTSNSDEAVADFDSVVMKYLSFNTDTGTSLKALLVKDPEMPMVHCIRGYFMMLMGVRVLVNHAAKSIAYLQTNRQRLNSREKMHADALNAWVTQSLEQASNIWCRIAENFPRDILAIKMANFGLFYQGKPCEIRNALASSLDYWSEGEDVQPYLMSMYAFGLEESGYPREAEAIAREALSRQPNDPWGIHVVAHAMEATGRVFEGAAFIQSAQEQWRGINNFRYHIAWHKALFHFEAGQYDDALMNYDQTVCSECATEYLDICNDASMLFRLELAGIDVQHRWEGIAAKVIRYGEGPMLAFADLHFVLALASSQDEHSQQLGRKMVASMEIYSSSSADDATIYRAAIPVAQSLLDFRDGRYRQAAEKLAGALPGLHVIGGSRAQRDLFASLMAESAWRSDKNAPKTIAMLAARTHALPHNYRGWEMYLSALQAQGCSDVMERARQRRSYAHDRHLTRLPL